MNERQTNIELLKVLFSHRKQILLSSILFFVVSLAITFFIPKQYVSTAIIYPTKSNSIKDVSTNPSIGFEMQTNRLIQLLESNKMRDLIAQKFDLATYYGIDTSALGWKHSLNKQYAKDFSFTRTKYLSIEISGTMKSAALAANCVNAMVTYIDTLRKEIFLKNTVLWVNDLSQKLSGQEHKVDSLLSILFLSNDQNTPLALAENKQTFIRNRKENATILQGDAIVENVIKNNYSVRTEKLINEYYMELGILNRFQSDLIQGRNQLSQPFPKVYVFSNAEIDDAKSSPSYKINGLIGGIAGFLLSLFYVVGINKWNQLSSYLKDA